MYNLLVATPTNDSWNLWYVGVLNEGGKQVNMV